MTNGGDSLVAVTSITGDARAELDDFWLKYPKLRQECQAKYGYDPLTDPEHYWPYGLAEAPHATVRAEVEAHGGVFSLKDVLKWEREELEHTKLGKAQPSYDPNQGTDTTWDKGSIVGAADLMQALEPLQKSDVRASGLAVRAADTGRMLLIQRHHADGGDPARGTWEFPGGILNPGEHPYTGAKREWQEETGVRLPKGRHAGEWRHGVYHGFIHEVPSEDSVKINRDHEDRTVLNPDDPDGDAIEVAAWFHPEQLKYMSALRSELRESRPWNFGDRVRKQEAGTVYLIAHAKTRYNRPGQPHDIVQGWRDIPLDNEGTAQARRIGKFLKVNDVDEIYSSDLKRAAQTADIASRVSGIKVAKKDKRYRPWNLGSFAGHSSADVIPKLKPFITDTPEKPVDGGESFNEYKDRFIPALEKLLEMADGGKNVALISHSRNIELAEGWIGGKGYRRKIDPQAIEDDKIDPGFALTVKKRGSRFMVAGKVKKAEAHPAELRLRVNGVSTHPTGMRSYRMVTRDGRYIGQTNPTRLRARKGDILKIQANDFMQDAAQNYHWINPNVVAHFSDAAHSWKELEALAGGLVKDFAEGPAGDAPPAGDVGNAGAALDPAHGETAALAVGSGPTMSDVHVNVPLKTISVSYQLFGRQGKGKMKYQVHKSDRMKQLVYGVVLEPNYMDAQEDFMLPDQVEKSAHTYLKKAIRGMSSVAKLQHRQTGFRRTRPSIVPVESFIAPVDFSYDGKEMIKKGSWVMCMHVEDDSLWKDFLDGKYTGFSVGGTGVRQSINYPGHSPDLTGRDMMPPSAADYAPGLAAMMSSHGPA